MKFNERVWEATRRVPRGKVTTYKEIARYLDTRAYRLVGQALKCNPDTAKTPCYRVIKSDGSIGGYGGSGPRKIREKARLLEKDGIRVVGGKVDLAKHLHSFRKR